MPIRGWRAAGRGRSANSSPKAPTVGAPAISACASTISAPAARRLEAAVRWRCRLLALPYGDQGLLLPAALYRALGGFRELPLMEDVDLARRLGRHRLVALAVDAVTSAARYRRDGYVARPLRNLCCLALYFLGVPPLLLQRLYR